jgi:hypothetical protein
MSSVTAAPRFRSDEALVIGLTGLLLIAGLTVGIHTPLAYLVMALPVVIGVSWYRPVYGFALLLGTTLLTEEFEINTLAGNIQPMLLQTLPIFRNLKDYTPLSGVQANAVELWLVLLAAVWMAQGMLSGRLRIRPPVCTPAWLLLALVLVVTFGLGISRGGDVKIALWEVRALGYLVGLAWLVPQIVERRRDLEVVVGVIALALGLKAIQGLFRYFVVLHMQLDLTETFMAHEDPVMFVPLFYLLAGLLHHRASPPLQRLMLALSPAMLVALVLTQRRIAYITLLLCGLAYAVAAVPAVRRTFLRLAMPLAAIAAVYVVAFAGSDTPLAQPIERALTLFDSGNASNVYRVIEMENLRYTIRQHPWGLGFGHPYEIVRSLPKLDFPLYEYIPHNEVMWIWVKAGTLGFVVVLFYFARLVAEAVWTARHLRDGLLQAVAVAVALAVINQMIASYYELQLTYARNMIYLGTLIGLLGPIREWGGLAPTGPRRWRL